MKIVINGEEREMESAPTVAELLRVLGLAERPVLVECNGEALRPRDFAQRSVAAGDQFEIVQVAAGG